MTVEEEIEGLKWPACPNCGRELEMLRPHVFDECYCDEFYQCVDCHKPLIKKESCVVADYAELRCHDCYIKHQNVGTL